MVTNYRQGDEPIPGSGYRLVRFLRRFSAVHTNRLHVGIVSTLLGQTVHLYENSFGKIGAVYKASMEGRYPNVLWHGSVPIQ